jgi:FkbM family methyltransferase
VRNLIATALRRATRLLDADGCVSYSQEGEDLVLARLLEGRGPGFYVDVGAHHPTRFSNTCFFYRQGWRGINIEPAPDVLAVFERERPRDINLQSGVAENPGTLTYYVFNDSALNTFDEPLKRDREVNTSYRVVRTIPIPVQRLDTILKRHVPSGRAIDFMSIDVEGLDLQVLRSNDWRVFRAEYVLVEALGFRLEAASSDPVHAFMVGVGYELVAKTVNTLFYRNAR